MAFEKEMDSFFMERITAAQPVQKPPLPIPSCSPICDASLFELKNTNNSTKKAAAAATAAAAGFVWPKRVIGTKEPRCSSGLD